MRAVISSTRRPCALRSVIVVRRVPPLRSGIEFTTRPRLSVRSTTTCACTFLRAMPSLATCPSSPWMTHATTRSPRRAQGAPGRRWSSTDADTLARLYSMVYTSPVREVLKSATFEK
jgi:hypothetical protein